MTIPPAVRKFRRAALLIPLKKVVQDMVDGYVLGLWLGAGQEGTPWMYLDPRKPDHHTRVDRIARRVRTCGYQAYFRKCRMHPKYVRLQLLPKGDHLPLGIVLTKLEVLHDPHIPEGFDTAAIQQGIDDTDALRDFRTLSSP